MWTGKLDRQLEMIKEVVEKIKFFMTVLASVGYFPTEFNFVGEVTLVI